MILQNNDSIMMIDSNANTSTLVDSSSKNKYLKNIQSKYLSKTK